MDTNRLTIWVFEPALAGVVRKLPFDIKTKNYRWDEWSRFHTDLLRSLSDNSGPDLIEFGNSWTSRLVQEGALLNITNLAKAQLRAPTTFFARTLYSCRHPFQPDQFYALPLLADVRVLFYNRIYVDEYLSTHPNAFKSWSEFEALCQELKERFEYVIAWPLDGSGFHDMLPWVWSAGGDFVSLFGQVKIDDERTVEAFCLLARLILKGYAPVPPDPRFDNLDGIRHQFGSQKIGMMAAGMWMASIPMWHMWCRAATYPPINFPAAFVGGSNIAIVKKKEHPDENDKIYETAKNFIQGIFVNDMQIELALSAGKLPCSIKAWQQTKQQTDDPEIRGLLNTFDDALTYTIERGMPNLPNFTQIEDALKTSTANIWQKVGELYTSKRSQDISDNEIKQMIKSELEIAKKSVGKFLTGYTIQYTSEEAAKIGNSPPGHFDLWLQVLSKEGTFTGQVYVKGKEERIDSITPKPFHILWALANSPDRVLNREQLLEIVWEKKPTVDYQQAAFRTKEITLLAELLKELPTSSNQAQSTLKKHQKSTPTSEVATSLLEQLQKVSTFREEWFRARVLDQLETQAQSLSHEVDVDSEKKALDSLRQHIRKLNQELEDVNAIEYLQEEGVYKLNENLSICLVVP